MKTEKFYIQIESVGLMVLDLQTTKKDFQKELKRLSKEFDDVYSNDEEYARSNGANKDHITRESEKIFEEQFIFQDGTTRTWFIHRKCKDGYYFKK